MTDIYRGYEKLESTPEENAESLKALEQMFITGLTVEKFCERVDAIWKKRVQAAVDFKTEPRTFNRWCNGQSKVPGNAWAFLALWEKTYESARQG